MKKKVLISTLGESPGVVTEALDFLKDRGIKIDKVILLTTVDSATEASANFLVGYLYQNYGITPIPIQTSAYEDIDSKEAVIEFLNNACTQLKYNQKNDVYVSVAGGRKTMSALMTLAVQFYGARSLFHIILVDPRIEEKSKINNLRKYDEEEQKKILHPPKDKLKFVEMPFIGLFPWISDILSLLKGEITNKKEIKDLLIYNGLMKDDAPTELGEIVLKILEQVESRPKPCNSQKKLQPKDIKHHGAKEASRLAEKMMNRFPYICKAKSAEWDQNLGVFLKEHNEIKINFQGKTHPLSVILTTTAEGKGQLEFVKKEIEEFLRKEKII